ncbi:MAG: hypothetical protein HOC23_01465, partial [Halieaceae bacterium]|nr:hypothetical protein [Halieaceae bacterium]
ATPEAMAAALEPLLDDTAQQQVLLREFDLIHTQLRLGSSERTARALANLMTASAPRTM